MESDTNVLNEPIESVCSLRTFVYIIDSRPLVVTTSDWSLHQLISASMFFSVPVTL